MDILCGKDKVIFNHIGNRRFRAIITSNLERYIEAPTKSSKSNVIRTIFSDLQRAGVRFLKKHKTTCAWYEIPAHEAKEKVSHALRDRVREKLKNGGHAALRKKRKSKQAKAAPKAQGMDVKPEPPSPSPDLAASSHSLPDDDTSSDTPPVMIEPSPTLSRPVVKDLPSEPEKLPDMPPCSLSSMLQHCVSLPDIEKSLDDQLRELEDDLDLDDLCSRVTDDECEERDELDIFNDIPLEEIQFEKPHDSLSIQCLDMASSIL